MAVEILGRACIAPSVANVQELLLLLKEERCAVTSIPSDRWNKARFWHPARSIQGKAYTFSAGVIDDVYGFDPALFGLSAREAAQMDPQQRILLQTVWRALEDARIDVPLLARERVGIYIGASSLDSGNLQVADPASGSPHFMTGNTLSIISNRISHIFGLQGPSMTIDTACSSSLVALHQARRALETGEIDTAIVGGVNLLLHPFSFIGFSQARMLSPEGLCRAYAENGEGYVRAEGAGSVVLRRADRVAREGGRSYATLLSTGVNSAGRTNGISLPSKEAQAELLSSIYGENGIDPNDLAFIEGHGTGTKVGDPAELWAIGTVLGKGRAKPLPIGSIKSNIGHAEPASGILGLIKAMLALENDVLPASLHADVLNQNVNFEDLNIEVNRSTRALERSDKRRLAGINSFGFGGTNVHVVISDPPKRAVEVAVPFSGMFVISAHTPSALQSLLGDYDTRLSSSDDDEVEAIVAASHDMSLRHRFAALGANSGDIADVISSYLQEGKADQAQVGEAPGRDVKTAFVYAGNGSQWAGMGLDAYQANAAFRAKFDAFSEMFVTQVGLDLSALIGSVDLEQYLRDTRVAQPLLFAVQAALTDCLVEKGIKPQVVFGHSVGEVAAAYAAGILTARDAVAIVAIRSRHQHSLAGKGAMAAAVMSEASALAFAKEHGLDNIVVAGVNAHNSVTISGPVEDVRQFKFLSQMSRHVVHVLDIDYPFHHPIIDSEREAFLRDIPKLTPKSGHTVFISTVTGTEMEGDELDADYWWRNVREPIAFEAAVSLAVAKGCNLFLEISPRPILSNYVIETAKQQSAAAAVLPTLSRSGREAVSDPVTTIALRAVAHGVSAQQRNECVPTIDLPAIPFETVSYRTTPTTDGTNLFGRDGADGGYTLLGWRNDPNSSVWKNHLDAQLFPDLAGHVVDGKSILPGSAFIEIALQAARQFFGAQEVEITNLEIFRPLELRETKIVELSTRLSPETGLIEIASREYLSDNGWTTHATARSRKPAVQLGAARLRPSNGKIHKIEGDEAYQTARSFGLDYADCFQLLKTAEVHDRKHVVVELQPAASPVHPYLSYGLDPVSTDAAFHGLVALFGSLTGEADGAPYIPVRFGSVCFASSEKPVTRAVIEIQRFSAHSLKSRIDLIAIDGSLVASLDDCRFRRTWLRQHATLETVTFHYEAVPGTIDLAAATKSSMAEGAGYLPTVDPTPVGDATLILNAAVLRASFDIGHLLADEEHIVSLALLPGDQEFRCFLTSCLYALQDAGIAQPTDKGWILPERCDLPCINDLLRQINARFPDRVAEAVLVNDAYREAMDRISGQSSLQKTESSVFLSDATLDHVRHHTALAKQREAHVLSAVEAALREVQPGDGFALVELCAVSPAFTQRLSQLVARKGGTLTVAESSEHLRRTLEIAFERNPSISCLDLENSAAALRADLVVSASGDTFGKVSRDRRLQAIMRSAASSGATFAVVDMASSSFADFIFGLIDGWFSNSVTSEFPIGQFATEDQWVQLLENFGFSTMNVKQRDHADGALLFVEASAAGHRPAAYANQTSFESIVEIVEIAHQSAGSFPDFDALPLTADSAETVFDAYLAERQGTLAFVFQVYRGGCGSERLQDSVQILSALAEAARRRMLVIGSPLRIRLVVLAEGGSPAGSAAPEAVASGLWTFVRTLENEYDEIEVLLLDPAAGNTMRSSAVLALLSTGEPDREWVQDKRTGLLSVVRAVPGHAANQDLKTNDFESASIRQLAAGRIDSISWEENKLPAPSAGEVSVKVAATGLNFRDVMWSMGLLPEEALEDGFAGATIGMEMSGKIVAVGDGVRDLAPGDKVMGIASQALSTHVAVARDGVTRIPAGVDLDAAATVPVAFLTAYYALVELGRIRQGDTILIHGAAGGVGLAALQIAKLNGAKVIATAGTVEKRRFLSLLGADHVFDSRSLAFVGDVVRVTDGKGVELVLNSLFAEAMERSFELLKPFGRFLELGKRDYYSDRKLALRPFRRNISYFGIDADQLLINEPELTRRIFREVGALFADGKLAPLPYRAFNYDETGPAFRLMQNAGHIGKIIIRPPQAMRETVQKREPQYLGLSSGVYLVVGGIGGFGLAAADWLAKRGASHVALCSRRGIPDDETLTAMAKWNAAGVDSSVHACDVTNEVALGALLDKLRSTGPIKGIVHAAMVLDDGLIGNLDRQRNRAVIDVKAKGAANLDRLTRQDKLELFLLFSSATTMIGNPGQANYVAANGYLEGLARARRAAGLPALAVGFGAISDAGFLARNTDVNDILARRIGKSAMKATSALNFVERILVKAGGTTDEAVIMVAEIDWASAGSLPLTAQPLFSAVRRNAISNAGAGDGDSIDLSGLISGKSREEASGLLHTFLAAEIASILKVAEDSIRADRALKDIGLDSLMAMELGASFQQKTGMDIPFSGMGEGATIGDIVQKLYDKVTSSTSTEARAAGQETSSVLTTLTEKHGANAQERTTA